MAKQVAVLAYNQPITGKASTWLKRDIAAMLVTRLMAEQISQRLIRMFPPNSSFPTLNCSQNSPQASQRYIPEIMPPSEVAGCKFQLPTSIQWRELHLQPRRYRTELSYLTSKALGSAQNARAKQ